MLGRYSLVLAVLAATIALTARSFSETPECMTTPGRRRHRACTGTIALIERLTDIAGFWIPQARRFVYTKMRQHRT